MNVYMHIYIYTYFVGKLNIFMAVGKGKGKRCVASHGGRVWGCARVLSMTMCVCIYARVLLTAVCECVCVCVLWISHAIVYSSCTV